MANSIVITPEGIRSALKKYDYRQAVAEYVWNGFDAKATQVDILYESNEIGNINKLIIKDNGTGIPHEKLKDKFEPFFESEKVIELQPNKNISDLHGKNGVGRLTFFRFATAAKWKTIYEDTGKNFEYIIKIDSRSLNKFSGEEETPTETDTKTGTEVSFEGVQNILASNIEGDIKDFLVKEFCWFLELKKEQGLSIFINGEKLDYTAYIADTDKAKFFHKETNTSFEVDYVRWKDTLNREYSNFYFLADGAEKYKEHTLLNNKGDQFYHSLYVRSTYFNDFNFKSIENGQEALIGGTRSDDAYKFFHDQIYNFLKTKRKPFLKVSAEKLVQEYNAEGVMPNFGSDEWEKLRKEHLEDVVRALYEVQPKIYTSLNVEQKKTFVGFLNLLLDSTEKDKILEIVKQIVDLSREEREELIQVLQATTLSRVIKTIKLIEDRYLTIDQVKEIVHNEELGANERDHLQKIIESHYWLFGEQYHLITAAEQKFEEALRRYRKIAFGVDKKTTINHPDKNGEMDIFLCRQRPLDDLIENVVLELKHPLIRVGEKELSQVKKYLSVILSAKEFNASNMKWTFYLIGNEYDKSGFIQGEIDNLKHLGEKSLVYSGERYKIYVKTWSEIFTEFELKHSFLNSKLQVEKAKLQSSQKTADTVVKESAQNSAAAVFVV